MVRPLSSEDYDLDDGVYLQHTDDDIQSPTPQTASQWLVDAVKGHVKKDPVNKKNCVRVVYADGYHIDLPVYRTIGGQTYLGTLDGNQWIASDPKTFNDWFRDKLKQSEQMRSCIKYLKAWKDFSSCDLKGIHLTVLVADNHVLIDGRDDESLAETVSNMAQSLRTDRAIYNPTDASENLVESWSASKIDRAIEALEDFHETASEAVAESETDAAAEKWQLLLGDRFPLPSSDEDESKSSTPPAVVIGTAPKPWSAMLP